MTALTFSGRWIPVTERLPDDDITVMLHQPDTSEAWILGCRDGEDWRTQDGCWIIYGVTHWADLPAGPQGCGTDGVPELPKGHFWRCTCGTVLKGGAAHMNCPSGVAPARPTQPEQPK